MLQSLVRLFRVVDWSSDSKLAERGFCEASGLIASSDSRIALSDFRLISGRVEGDSASAPDASLPDSAWPATELVGLVGVRVVFNVLLVHVELGAVCAEFRPVRLVVLRVISLLLVALLLRLGASSEVFLNESDHGSSDLDRSLLHVDFVVVLEQD